MGFPGDSEVKASACNVGDPVRSLDQEDPLEKEMATRSSILAWRIQWMEEPGRLQFTGSQRVGHDWATSLHFTSLIRIDDVMLGWRSGLPGVVSPAKWLIKFNKLCFSYTGFLKVNNLCWLSQIQTWSKQY